MAFYLLQGQVYHSRSETAKNSFKYPIFNIYYSVAQTRGLQALLQTKFKSLLSFKDEDYLMCAPQAPLAEKSQRFLADCFDYQADQIFLQTIPRMFGYAFNPVSFWYCYRQEKLEAVLCEVNNTFGETHYYWLYQEGEDLNNKWLKAEKKFHVSPFFAVEGEYRFRFRSTKNHLHTDIHFLNGDGTVKLNTWVQGELIPLEEVSFIGLMIRYGWMTPLVVFRIHYQAVKLLLKKVKYFKKPNPPEKEITYGTSFMGR